MRTVVGAGIAYAIVAIIMHVLKPFISAVLTYLVMSVLGCYPLTIIVSACYCFFVSLEGRVLILALSRLSAYAGKVVGRCLVAGIAVCLIGNPFYIV